MQVKELRQFIELLDPEATLHTQVWRDADNPGWTLSMQAKSLDQSGSTGPHHTMAHMKHIPFTFEDDLAQDTA